MSKEQNLGSKLFSYVISFSRARLAKFANSVQLDPERTTVFHEMVYFFTWLSVATVARTTTAIDRHKFQESLFLDYQKMFPSASDARLFSARFQQYASSDRIGIQSDSVQDACLLLVANCKCRPVNVITDDHLAITTAESLASEFCAEIFLKLRSAQ